ncbi:jg27082 [Pararge aegeria aegeria]|uniref:Jg27082 protein n=1 Tax=Pararge aegeria aegeria TaxID=348720 RepID=A0A8S4QP46_9NEOP|nr:jg27082 [Pararge aegeria aegeria]
MPAVHSSRRQNEENSLYVEIPPEPPQPTIASLAAARSVTPDTLLRTAALGLHHSPMMAPHLKFGMLVSFALATVFLAGAKYYFDRQCIFHLCVINVVCGCSVIETYIENNFWTSS